VLIAARYALITAYPVFIENENTSRAKSDAAISINFERSIIQFY
jgi:hypothetical protein